MEFSGVLVHWAEVPLLNGECFISCRLKERNKGTFSSAVLLTLLLYQFFCIMLSYNSNLIQEPVHFSNSVMFDSLQPCGLQHAQCQSLSITNSQSLLKLMSIESVMLSNHFFLCHSLLLLPSIFPSIRVFSRESVLHIRWPKYWSLSFSISPSNEYPGLISLRMDWLDLFAVQGTLKSLLRHHSSKASILQCSAFLLV